MPDTVYTNSTKRNVALLAACQAALNFLAIGILWFAVHNRGRKAAAA